MKIETKNDLLVLLGARKIMFILDSNKVFFVTVRHREEIQHDMAEISSSVLLRISVTY